MIKYILLLIFISPHFLAQKSYETKLEEGIEYSYNLDFQKSAAIYRSLTAAEPDNPAAYHYLSRDRLYRFLGSGDEADFNSFFDYSNLAVEKAERLLEKKSGNQDIKFILGSAQFLRSIAHSYKGENMDAFFSAKNAKGNLEDVVEENPKYYDAYLGIGALKYALSEISGFATLALKLARLSGNKNEGLELVKKTYDSGERLKPEAAFQLSKIYNDYLAFYGKASEVLEPIIKKYPNNVLFLYQYAIAKMNDRKLDEAEKILRRVLKINNADFHQTNSYSNFLLGDIFFKKNEFAKAIENYKRFLKSTNELAYTGIANLRISISQLFLGRDLEARKSLLLAQNGNPDIKEDEFAKERSKEILSDGLSEEEKTLIYNKHKIESGNFEEALENLKNKKFIVRKLETARKALSAEALLYTDNLSKAAELAESIIETRDEETYSYAFAKWINAKVYFRKGEFKTAKDVIDDLEIKENFEDSQKLKAKVEGLKRMIRERS